MNRTYAAPSPFRFAWLLLGLMMAALLSACGGGGGSVGLPTGVALYTTAPAGVTVAAGAASTYTVGGGNPTYTVSSSNKDVATATVSGTSFTITGLSAGSATISVTDAVGASVQVPVTVSGVVTPPVIPPGSLFTTAGGSVTVAVGASANYSIGGGKPAYAVSSSNAAVATASVSGTNFTVTGVGAGAAQIVVTDSAGISLTLEVTVGAGTTVAFYTTAPNAVTIGTGAVAGYLVGGGKPAYAVSSSNAAVAKGTISGTSLTITGVSAGTAQVVVFDASGDSIAIAVTIGAGSAATPLYTTAASAVTIALGAPGSYTIGGGAGGYLATTSNASVATVSVSGATLTITAMSAGSAAVKVFDSLGSSVTIDVTAQQAAISVFPEAAGGNVGDSLHFLVSGGTPPYTVTMNNTNIATVSPSTVNGSGGGFDITLVNVGTTSAVIVDAAGKSATVPVTVSQISTILRLSPNALLVGENFLGTIDLNIFGGTGPYRAFTSDQTLSSVSVNGSILTIGLGSRANRCINPATDDGTYIPNGTFDVTVTAVDSLGASATSVMTIKDNGFGLNANCP